MENEKVASPTPSDDSDFELVTRKRRGKKNSKAFNFNGSRNQRNNAGNGYRNNRENTSENVIYGEPYVANSERVSYVNARSNTRNMIHTDAQLKKGPDIPKEEMLEEEEIPKEVPESVPTTPSPAVERINTRALPKFAETYELEKFSKNALLVFNQINIDGYAPRLGTEKDVEELENTFMNFGFEVEVENDLTRSEIMDRLKEFTSRDFTDYGCVAIAVLTHGSKDGSIKAKDLPYSEVEIISQLQVRDKPTLITKPRIVIIQACRGTKSIKAVPVGISYGIQKDLSDEIEPYTLPVESDMLVLHSSYIGKVSHRHELYGSWFIQALCGKIKELWSETDLEGIMTVVKREVAIDREHDEWNRRAGEYNTNKQMPVTTSTLIRKLYLKKTKGKALESISDGSRRLSVSQARTTTDVSRPTTPLPLQDEQCPCYLDYFLYIKNCLSYYLEDNIEDSIAQSYLDIANTYEDSESFNSAKNVMVKLIRQHLMANGKDCEYYKYLYFYNR